MAVAVVCLKVRGLMVSVVPSHGKPGGIGTGGAIRGVLMVASVPGDATI